MSYEDPAIKSDAELMWEVKALASIKLELEARERSGQLTKKQLMDMCAHAIMEHQKLRLIITSNQAVPATDTIVQDDSKAEATNVQG